MKSTRNSGDFKLTESRWKARVEVEAPVDIKAQTFPGAFGTHKRLETLDELSTAPKSQRAMLKPIPARVITSVDLLSPRRKPASQLQNDIISLQTRVMNLEVQISLVIEQNKLLIQQQADFNKSIDKKIIEKIEMSRDSGNKKDDYSYAERSVHGHRKPSPSHYDNKSISKSTIGQREPDQLAPPASMAASKIDKKDESHISEEPSKGLTDRTAREQAKPYIKSSPPSCWSKLFCCLPTSNKVTRLSPTTKTREAKTAVSLVK